MENLVEEKSLLQRRHTSCSVSHRFVLSYLSRINIRLLLGKKQKNKQNKYISLLNHDKFILCFLKSEVSANIFRIFRSSSQMMINEFMKMLIGFSSRSTCCEKKSPELPLHVCRHTASMSRYIHAVTHAKLIFTR